MSYPMELDEISEFLLQDELYRRATCRKNKLCPYCDQPIWAPPCKMREWHRPKIITLCGSTRFEAEYKRANAIFTAQGYIVLSVGLVKSDDLDVYGTSKDDLDVLHKRKIEMSDEIFVINKGGYIGVSTESEIKYAEQLNLPINYLEEQT